MIEAHPVLGGNDIHGLLSADFKKIEIQTPHADLGRPPCIEKGVVGRKRLGFHGNGGLRSSKGFVDQLSRLPQLANRPPLCKLA